MKQLKRFMAPWRHLSGQRSRPSRQPVILCGLDYEHYRILSLVKQSKHYETLALINDFPWNHGTLVDGVRVYYPSEALSLIKRHGVQRVLCHSESDLAVFDTGTLSALKELGVMFSSVDPQQIVNFDDYLASQP